MEQLRSAERAPDHGHGALGRVAHSVVAENLVSSPGVAAPLGEAPSPGEPAIFFCYNTLPDPPFPMAGHIRLGVAPGAFAASGGDLLPFLEAAAGSLRAQPVPPPSSFDESYHRLQRMLRIDAVALCTRAHFVRTQGSPAAGALAANLAEGRLRPGDLDASPAAEARTSAWLVDRRDVALLATAPEGATEAGITVSAFERDGLIERLAGLLDAQYTWTAKAFGL
ncbi:hypothetical protein [Actinomadura harenae]|uniref:Uncharacterized protein n=1 Tax=Actinomadura harenae TaxID=2483351 RepID=A0A3M2M5U2_9ACTN|nr:hypothetical protein [Actinomadura harenae]RMI45134.1 hypothetical protein EBO15_11265 [Actinomadura harenae]